MTEGPQQDSCPACGLLDHGDLPCTQYSFKGPSARQGTQGVASGSAPPSGVFRESLLSMVVEMHAYRGLTIEDCDAALERIAFSLKTHREELRAADIEIAMAVAASLRSHICRLMLEQIHTAVVPFNLPAGVTG